MIVSRLQKAYLFAGILVFEFSSTTWLQTSPGSVRTGDKIDILQIAGKSNREVAAVLGKPTYEGIDKTSVLKPPVKEYKRGAVEVDYIDGKADWITIYPTKLRFERTSMRALGLPDRPPTFANQHVLRWVNIAGLKDVQLFARADGGVDYVLVTTRRKQE